MIREFLGLSPDRRRFLLATATTLIGVDVALRTVGVDRAASVSTALGRLAPANAAPTEVRRAIDALVPRLPIASSCLVEALTAGALIDRAGHDATLRIGVDPTGSEFEAHAWIESGDRVVVGDVPDHDRFRPLPLDDRWP